jgi:hypothetical protein
MSEWSPGNPNSGHGLVHPRPDGMRFRCGGARMCAQCAREQAAVDEYAAKHRPGSVRAEGTES